MRSADLAIVASLIKSLAEVGAGTYLAVRLLGPVMPNVRVSPPRSTRQPGGGNGAGEGSR